MSITSVSFLSCLFILLLSCPASTQQTSDIHQIPNCNHITKQAFRNKAQQYVNNPQVQRSIESNFPLDKYKLIQGIISQNTTMVLESMNQTPGMYVLNFGILLLFFLLMLVLIPILLCTKCCNCCCKRGVNEPYSSCEIKWPGACVILLALALIGISVAIIITNVNYQPKFNDFKCSLSLMADDIINGGSSLKDNITFMGLNQYLGRLNNFISNLTETKLMLASSLGSDSQNMTALHQQTTALIEDISKIPNPDGSELQLMYSRPLSSHNPVALQQSLFPAILGTSTSPDSMIFNLSSAAEFLDQSLKNIQSWAAEFGAAVENIDTKQARAGVKTQIRSIEQLQFNIHSTIGIVEKGLAKYYVIGSYVLLGLTIFVTICIFFLQCCHTCCDKYSTGPKLTCCCGFLWFFGLLFYVIAFGFSLGNPAMFYGCQYIREGFASEKGYNKNIAKFLTQDSSIVTVVGKCLSSSRDPYYLYDNISIGLNPNISELTVYQQVPTLRVQSSIKGVESNFTFIIETTRQYRTAQTLDIENLSMIEEIRGLAMTEECFPDEWVPSLKQNPPLIQCQFNMNADNNTCPNTEAFVSRSDGCVGCMDTYSVLERFITPEELNDELKRRYTSCFSSGRSEVVENLTQIWYNYYFHKREKIEPVEQRAIKLQTNFNSSKTFIQTQIFAKLIQVSGWLENEPVIQESTNKTGLVKEAMDCRLLGKDIDMSINILCSAGLTYVHDLRYFYTASAIMIFFMCALTICLVSRSSDGRKLRGKKALQNQQMEEKQSKAATERKLVTHGYFN